MTNSAEYCGIVGRRGYGMCWQQKYTLWIQLYLLRKCVGCDCVTYKYIQNICTVYIYIYTYTYHVYIYIYVWSSIFSGSIWIHGGIRVVT